jgi:hypothetical protein
VPILITELVHKALHIEFIIIHILAEALFRRFQNAFVWIPKATEQA